MSRQSLREVIQEGWTGSRGHVTPSPCPSPPVPRSPGTRVVPLHHIKGLRPSGHGCSAGLGPQTHSVTWEAAFSLRVFLLSFNLDPVTSLPPAALCASLFQDFVPLMAENFLQFSSLNLFMASVYFLFLCQVCLLDLLPPQHFPCPHLFIVSRLFFFFSFFSTEPFKFLLTFPKPNFWTVVQPSSLAVF